MRSLWRRMIAQYSAIAASIKSCNLRSDRHWPETCAVHAQCRRPSSSGIRFAGTGAPRPRQSAYECPFPWILSLIASGVGSRMGPTGPYLGTATVTLHSQWKSTPFCDEN
jgi:hypothetical protein